MGLQQTAIHTEFDFCYEPQAQTLTLTREYFSAQHKLACCPKLTLFAPLALLALLALSDRLNKVMVSPLTGRGFVRGCRSLATNSDALLGLRSRSAGGGEMVILAFLCGVVFDVDVVVDSMDQQRQLEFTRLLAQAGLAPDAAGRVSKRVLFIAMLRGRDVRPNPLDTSIPKRKLEKWRQSGAADEGKYMR